MIHVVPEPRSSGALGSARPGGAARGGRPGRRAAAAAGVVVAAVLAAAGVAGCAATAPPAPVPSPPGGPADPAAVGAAPPDARDAAGSDDVERLVALARRRAAGWDDDYPIGPGDLIEVSVPAVVEIQDVTVRVAPDGTVALPLLGTLRAAGRTESGLRDEIRAALGRYMYEPQFTLLVVQHRNREVGVLGAVAKPGPYSVEGRRETVLDMLSEAGGLTDDATRRILFIPVADGDAAPVRVASLDTVSSAGSDSPEAAPVPQNGSAADAILPRASAPIVIDLDGMDQPTQQLALSMPVRPGDTLMVLGGGKVFLRGWVANPGAYDMTRGLSVLGAIAQAGGFSFPAREDRVRVLREQPGSNVRREIVVDVAAVQDGRGEDVPVREGDIIQVRATVPKLAVYGVYSFVSSLIRVGLALTPF